MTSLTKNLQTPTKKDEGAIFSGPFSTETTWLCLLGQVASLLSVVRDRWLCRMSPSGHFDTWHSKRDRSGRAGVDICYRQVLPEQQVLVYKISSTEKPINRTKTTVTTRASTNENWLSTLCQDNRDWQTVIQGQ